MECIFLIIAFQSYRLSFYLSQVLLLNSFLSITIKVINKRVKIFIRTSFDH